MTEHILVVDDDERLRNLLGEFLRDQHYHVSLAQSAKEARERLQFFKIDVMILDVMMPEESGLDFIRLLENKPPTLMLSARGEGEDRIRGLEAGVDDYLVKPFEPRELLLRIQNIVNRGLAKKTATKEVTFGEYRFHLENGTLYHSNEEIYLTTSEQALLRLLAQEAGKPISREKLAESMAHVSIKTNERSVDVQINRLRKKIEPIAGRPNYIRTVRHAGYALMTDYGTSHDA